VRTGRRGPRRGHVSPDPGLEVKRELVLGELADRRRAAVPALAALAGLVVPALVYALFNLAGDRVRVFSAGSQPADQLNRVAIAEMAEDGIDITTAQPKLLTPDAVEAADVVITMGCGDTCPVFPGKRYEDWALDDPAGQPLEVVRRIRDDIHRRIRRLAAELTSQPSPPR
jgi:protein-tyrosine-phosphatase